MFPEFLCCARSGIEIVQIDASKTAPLTVPSAVALLVDMRVRAKNGARRTQGATARWAVGVEERRGNTRNTQVLMQGITPGQSQPWTSLLFIF
jgi:hypothetical protein